MKQITFGQRSIPIALLLTCYLAFGLLIPWLGFYWDDWPSIWYLHSFGSTSFKDIFAYDRPLLGWLFMLTTPMVGESPFAWQVFGVLTRWLCSLSFWWLLLFIWPRHVRQATWAALLFAVYPGFRQQFIAVTYSHDWIVMALFFISLALMVWAVRRPGWFWPLSVGAWLLSAYCMFADEYYFGLELLRPLILWIVLQPQIRDWRKRVRRILAVWLPYLLIMAAFLYWRLVIFESPRGNLQVFSLLSASPIAGVIGLVVRVVGDVFRTSVLAWADVFNFPRMTSQGTATTLLYALAVLAGFAVVFFYLWKLRPQSGAAEDPASMRSWGFQALAVGGWALLIGGIPFWVTEYPITLSFPWDRFTLPMMVGTSLVLTSVIELLVRPVRIKTAILALLVGLAIGMQIFIGTQYRREWASQKNFFWQLAWRAPGLTPGTAVITADLPFTYFSDNSLTAPLNWLYAPESTALEMPYIFYNVESRQDKQLTNFHTNQPISIPYRLTNFTGSTSQAVALFYQPPGCLRIADPTTDAVLPQKPKYFSEILPLSDPSWILSDSSPAAQPPEHIFGPEPAPNWCYYYEKADLARQAGDWKQVVALADQAFQSGTKLYDINAPELIPYVEGYARLGRWDDAYQRSLQAYQLTQRIQRMLCASWQTLLLETPATAQRSQAAGQVAEQIGCKF
jgi:hypothetical protein